MAVPFATIDISKPSMCVCSRTVVVVAMVMSVCCDMYESVCMCMCVCVECAQMSPRLNPNFSYRKRMLSFVLFGGSHVLCAAEVEIYPASSGSNSSRISSSCNNTTKSINQCIVDPPPSSRRCLPPIRLPPKPSFRCH